MYNLSLHIEYLLLRHDCVVVPGVGAFINVRHAAQWNDASGAWMPMRREVRFNSALNHDDGLLANSFARKQKVSFVEGRELLRRETQQLLTVMREEGEVTLGQLGILRREEDVIIFTPLRDAGKVSAMIGFSAAAVSKPRQLTPDETNRENNIDTAEDLEMTGHKIAHESTDTNSKFDTHKNYYIGINKTFARVAACLILVSVIALSVILPGSEGHKIDRASVVPVEKILQQTASTISETDVAVSRQKSAGSVDTTRTEESAKMENNAVGKKFHAIVATFNTEAEADKFIRMHENTGYELNVITTPTRSRVSVLDSNNRESMRSEMSSPEFKTHFADAWIWEHVVE